MIDYEKKYNEALERAQKVTRAGGDVAMVIVQNIFPELRESEDERIRKDLITYLKSVQGETLDLTISVPKWIAYLEKQKEQKPADEQFPPLEGLDAIKAKYYDDGFKNGFDEGVESVKPAEWSEEDENTINLMIAILRENHPNGLFKTNPVNTTCMSAISTDMLIKRIESLRPQPKVELSEDDQKTLDEVSHILSGLNYKQIAKDYKQAVEKLLSLRPSWKPSEEQMEALEQASDVLVSVLNELYNDLKKLM